MDWLDGKCNVCEGPVEWQADLGASGISSLCSPCHADVVADEPEIADEYVRCGGGAT